MDEVWTVKDLVFDSFFCRSISCSRNSFSRHWRPSGVQGLISARGSGFGTFALSRIKCRKETQVNLLHQNSQNISNFLLLLLGIFQKCYYS